MELQVYTPANSGAAPKGKPTVRINPKSGTISFGAAAALKADIKLNDTVAMGYSTKDKTWYFFKKEDGFRLRTKNVSKPHLDLTFNNSGLARKILNATAADPSKLYSVGVATEEDGVNYFPLIG